MRNFKDTGIVMFKVVINYNFISFIILQDKLYIFEIVGNVQV